MALFSPTVGGILRCNYAKRIARREPSVRNEVFLLLIKRYALYAMRYANIRASFNWYHLPIGDFDKILRGELEDRPGGAGSGPDFLIVHKVLINKNGHVPDVSRGRNPADGKAGIFTHKFSIGFSD
jgi:hypothetical protein